MNAHFHQNLSIELPGKLPGQRADWGSMSRNLSGLPLVQRLPLFSHRLAQHSV